MAAWSAGCRPGPRPARTASEGLAPGPVSGAPLRSVSWPPMALRSSPTEKWGPLAATTTPAPRRRRTTPPWPGAGHARGPAPWHCGLRARSSHTVATASRRSMSRPVTRMSRSVPYRQVNPARNGVLAATRVQGAVGAGGGPCHQDPARPPPHTHPKEVHLHTFNAEGSAALAGPQWLQRPPGRRPVGRGVVGAAFRERGSLAVHAHRRSGPGRVRAAVDPRRTARAARIVIRNGGGTRSARFGTGGGAQRVPPFVSSPLGDARLGGAGDVPGARVHGGERAGRWRRAGPPERRLRPRRRPRRRARRRGGARPHPGRALVRPDESRRRIGRLPPHLRPTRGAAPGPRWWSLRRDRQRLRLARRPRHRARGR